MKQRDLANLLNRAANALLTPDEFTDQQRMDLSDELNSAGAQACVSGKPFLDPQTENVFARDVKVGDVLEKYGCVDKVEDTGDGWIQISYAGNGGNWGDFDAAEILVLMKP